jgi:transposase
VYAALEHRIRRALHEQGATFPNQKGKRIQTPTARWVFHDFVGIHVLYPTGQWPQVLNLTEEHCTLADLPWADFQVRLEVRVRKFFCGNAACHQRIFTERLPDVAQPWARRTLRLAQSLLAVGVALGGRAGSRLTQRLQRPTPPASLLRVVQHAPILKTPTLRAVGVDDWAWRRGHHYGTILVNLETHRVVELLPDRAANTVAQWLAQHPRIEVVSRDRSALYANGIAQGAPRAVQVVDRFHLVSNLREALEAFCLAHPAALKEAAARTAQAMVQRVDTAPVIGIYRGRRHSPQNWKKRQERQRQRHQDARVARYDQIRRLHDNGATCRSSW